MRLNSRYVEEGFANPATIELLTGETADTICGTTLLIDGQLLAICFLSKYPSHTRHDTKSGFSWMIGR